MTYLTQTQIDQLLKPINPARVGKAEGLAHLEAYDVRAHLSRIFGLARWSEDTTDLVMLYEQSKDDRWRAAYRATVRLTVCAPDGTILATYTESAVGTNFGWLPDSKRADTHDMAIKTAASQALKRCAINLGDQYGLSLYRKGSLAPIVGRTLVAVDGEATEDLTDHITEPLPPESETAPDPTEKSTPPEPTPEPDTSEVDALRADILAPAHGSPNVHYAKLQARAAKAGLLSTVVADRNGEPITIKKMIDQELAS